MKTHEFADIFPLMNPKEFRELKEDIKQNGLIDPILIYEGKILDGRNRFNACFELGVEVDLKEFTGKDALQLVMSTNLKRRHLTESQKAVVGIRYKKYYSEKYTHGGNKQVGTSSLLKNEGLTHVRDKAGEVVGVSGKYIDMAESVIKLKPEMEQSIMKGEIKVKQAYRDIKLEEQKKEIETIKDAKGEYDVIVIDPPWQYYKDEKYDNEHYIGRIVAPYPTMDINQIRNIKLPSSENSVLFLWTTHKFLEESFNLMEKWGYDYKATMVWDKEKLGIGKTLRMQCEFCLVGFKGRPYWKLTNQRDIIREARTTHSAKPESFYTFVDSITVGRKLDYFARKDRKGWDVYGDEVKNEKGKS